MGFCFEDEKAGAAAAVQAVRKLAADVGLPSFASLGVRESDFDRLAEMSAKNISTLSNPRPMSKEDYLTVLKRAQVGR
jgi:alcohol dehydrogenase